MKCYFVLDKHFVRPCFGSYFEAVDPISEVSVAFSDGGDSMFR